jgi:glutathionylspermidine synthase
MLEYNADTPTALYEAAVFQWAWLEDQLATGALPQGADQFNSLHDKLIARFAEIARGADLHLTAMIESTEDRGTAEYLADCAKQAGLRAHLVGIADIGLAPGGRFVDLENRVIERLFKLYPWEWMWADAFGKSPAMNATRFLEPPWKALLSNKGLLPMLWDMAPGHPNLLPAFFEDDPGCTTLGTSYARKPLLSREGANVSLVSRGRVEASADGDYGAEGFIRQALTNVPRFDGNYAVIGSWVVGEAAAGMGIREDKSPITGNRSRFVPHAIVG